jgi:hypothetical protein
MIFIINIIIIIIIIYFINNNLFVNILIKNEQTNQNKTAQTKLKYAKVRVI